VTAPPPLLVLTHGERAEAAGHDLIGVLARCVDAGLRAVVVRERHLPRDERSRLIARTEELLSPVDGLVVVAAPGLAPHHHLHLPAAAAVPEPRPAVLGRSCHDRGELERAAREGCAYATLSPIFPTPSKPGYGPPLGPAVLGDAPLPVYALGGVDDGNAAACTAAGAAGVAVMGAVMAARDPAGAVSRLLDALGARR
jgi:thiamine monophosphate synthase